MKKNRVVIAIDIEAETPISLSNKVEKIITTLRQFRDVTDVYQVKIEQDLNKIKNDLLNSIEQMKRTFGED